MKRSFFLWFRLSVPLVLCMFITACRYLPLLAEGYARCVYPVLSASFSAFSSLFPFSLEEPLVAGVVLWLLLWPFVARRKKLIWRSILLRQGEVLMWIYIWFYLGWGLNYFRTSIYARAQAVPVQYDEQAFFSFLTEYTDRLNCSYTVVSRPDMQTMDREMRAFYREVPSSFGLSCPKDFQYPKYFTFTSLYSSVGVLGSMGPFFAEAQLNADLLPVQLPFTYAHEFSHLLGVSNEAEANFWAYQVCIRSSLPEVRYSGYFGILPYVLLNASSLLSESDFRDWVQTIRPEVRADYDWKRIYWQGRYSPLIGGMQDFLYDWFLKRNRISSGKKNYAEVVGLLLAVSLP